MTMGVALLGGKMVGGLLSKYAGYRAGTYAANVAEYNASVARVSAEDIKRVAAIEYGQEKKINKRIVSTQKAAYGASGVAMEGSPMNVMLNSAVTGEYNALLRKYGTLSESAALELQAGIYEEQARIARQERMGSILTSGIETAGKIKLQPFLSFFRKTTTLSPFVRVEAPRITDRKLSG